MGHPECEGHRYLYKEGYPRKIEGELAKFQVVDIAASYYHCLCLVVPKQVQKT